MDKDPAPASPPSSSPEHFLGTNNKGKLIEDCRAAGAEIIECGGPAFTKMSYRDRPDGLLAIAPQVTRKLADLKLPANPLLLVCVSIGSPTSAPCSGPPTPPGWTPCSSATPRPTSTTPTSCAPASAPSSPCPWSSAAPPRRAPGSRSAASQTLGHHARHRGHLSFNVDMRPPTALILGCEQLGLDREWLAQAGHKIRIPMLGQADSLNVSAACTLVLYEAVPPAQIFRLTNRPAASAYVFRPTRRDGRVVDCA